MTDLQTDISNITAALANLADKSEIKELIIKLAVDEGIQSLEKITLEVKNEVLAEMNVDKMKSDICSLQNENDNLTKELGKQTELIRQFTDKCDVLTTRTNEAFRTANQNEQYSRKNNIKIFDLPEEQGEDLFKVVSGVLREKGGVTIQEKDIVAVHRIEHANKQITKPVLIKFRSTQAKIDVFKARKQLKQNKSVRISDDVTRANVMLMNRLKSHPRIENAWYFNGRVYGQSTGGKKYKFYPFEDISDVLNK